MYVCMYVCAFDGLLIKLLLILTDRPGSLRFARSSLVAIFIDAGVISRLTFASVWRDGSEVQMNCETTAKTLIANAMYNINIYMHNWHKQSHHLCLYILLWVLFNFSTCEFVLFAFSTNEYYNS